MSDALYQLGVEEWRRAWHWLSPESQACPPDLCTVQVYDVTDRANSARQHGDSPQKVQNNLEQDRSHVICGRVHNGTQDQS